jgi:holo-[acyl-carrier protein] synthase
MTLELPPGGILLGLGCDLIEIQRIRDALERHGESFLDRVYTEEERAYCSARPQAHLHFAARWAAKEAVAKAFTTGIGAALGWKSVSIYHGSRQEPLVRLDDKGRSLLEAVGGTAIHVSLSHTASAAMAVAALLRAPGNPGA